MEEHPEARPLGLAYFGSFDPRTAGIEFTLPTAGIVEEAEPSETDEESIGPRPGWFAVSVSLLRGHDFPVPDGQGGLKWRKKGSYTYFLRFRPIAMAGYSIYLYHVRPDEANQVRRQMGLKPLASSEQGSR